MRIAHPAPLAAALVLGVNDLLLKGSAVPGVVTGKLSDFAGLFLLPILLSAITRRRSMDGVWCAATAVGFVALKLHPGTNALAERWWGGNVMDPTDLIALPMTLVAWWWLGCPRASARENPFARVATLAGAGFLCMATPAAPPSPPRPVAAWEITADAKKDAGCARAAAWVSKSGKTGVGLTLRIGNPSKEAPCVVSLREASFAIGVESHAASLGYAGAITLAPCETKHVYVPFELDNEAAWNRGEMDGTFRLALASSSEVVAWTLPAEHAVRVPYWDRWNRGIERTNPCHGDRL